METVVEIKTKRCNRLIGNAKENINLLTEIIKYLNDKEK